MAERTRPAVTVVVPFKGDEAAARRLLDALESIILAEGDELLAVDNTADGAVAAVAEARRVRVLRATLEASSYYARNIGAEEARTEWILFTDADCRPPPTILDDYFAAGVGDRCGALGGEVVGAEGQTSVVARYASARRHMNQEGHLRSSIRPFAATVNLLVRREAWLDVGGFCEGIRTGGDQDFSWRLQDRGWTLGYAAEAITEHVHRERVFELLEQALRYGTAVAWLGRRNPNTYRRASVARSLGGATRILARAGADAARRRGEPTFAALDALAAAAFALGPLVNNRARRNDPAPPPRHVALVERFERDAVGATATHVEALRRQTFPRPWLHRDLVVTFAEDDGDLRHAVDLVWLAGRHPLRFGAMLISGRATLRSLLMLSPTARRLARATRAGASWAADASRKGDGELLDRLLGRRRAGRRDAVAKADTRGR